MIPARLSYTRCNALFCPAMYQAYYLRGVPETSSEEADRGKLLHEIAAEYNRRLSKYSTPKRQLNRASNMFRDVYNEHTKLVSFKEYEDMQEIGDNFVEMYTRDPSTLHTHVEYEMAVTRDFEQLDISKAIYPTGLARMDCFTGIADLLLRLNDEITGILYDWKMGNQFFDMFEAQGNRQLQGYAYLAFKTHPELERILATLLAPKFRQISTADFKRELLIPQFEEYLAGQWYKVDLLRKKYGSWDWPAQVNYDLACKWCRDSKDFKCPKKEALCGRSKAA